MNHVIAAFPFSFYNFNPVQSSFWAKKLLSRKFKDNRSEKKNRHHFCTHFNYHNTSHLSITSNHFASLVIILTHFAIIYAITLPSYPHQKSVLIEVTLPSLLNHLHHFAITFASNLRALLGQTKICVQGRIRQGKKEKALNMSK